MLNHLWKNSNLCVQILTKCNYYYTYILLNITFNVINQGHT